MQRLYKWLEEMKKKDEKAKMEEMHQHMVAQMIKSAGLLTAWKRKGKNGQKTVRVMRRRRMWRKSFGRKDEELRSAEEALPRLKECHLEEVSRLCKAKTGAGCDGFHPEGPLGLKQRKREDKSWSSWRRWSRVESGRNKLAQRWSS